MSEVPAGEDSGQTGGSNEVGGVGRSGSTAREGDQLSVTFYANYSGGVGNNSTGGTASTISCGTVTAITRVALGGSGIAHEMPRVVSGLLIGDMVSRHGAGDLVVLRTLCLTQHGGQGRGG